MALRWLRSGPWLSSLPGRTAKDSAYFPSAPQMSRRLVHCEQPLVVEHALRRIIVVLPNLPQVHHHSVGVRARACVGVPLLRADQTALTDPAHKVSPRNPGRHIAARPGKTIARPGRRPCDSSFAVCFRPLCCRSLACWMSACLNGTRPKLRLETLLHATLTMNKPHCSIISAQTASIPLCRLPARPQARLRRLRGQRGLFILFVSRRARGAPV